MVRIGKLIAPRLVATSPTAPASRPPRAGDVFERQLPRKHTLEAEVKPAESFMSWVARLFGAEKRPVAAAMMGLAPSLVAGAPLTAHAAAPELVTIPVSPTHAPIVDATALARRYAVDPARLSASEHRASGLRLVGIEQALLRQALALERLPPPSGIEEAVGRAEAMSLLGDSLAGVDALLALDAEVPASLLAELEGLAGAKLDGLDGAIRGLSAPAKSLLAAQPSELQAQARAAIAAYSSAMGGVESVLPPTLPFPITLPMPITYASGDTTVTLGAGATLQAQGGVTTITAPSASYAQGDVEVVAGATTLRLGGGVDALAFDTLEVADTLEASGVTAAVDRARGTALIAADEATIDLDDGTVSLSGARLVVDADGALHLAASEALWAKGGDQAAAAGLTIDATDSQIDAAARHLEATIDGASLTAEGVRFSMSDGEALTLHLEGASYASEELTLALGSTDASLEVAADGTTTMSVGLDALELKVDGASLSSSGATTLTLVERPDGSLASASASATELALTLDAGTLSASGGSASLVFDADGRLESAVADASSLSYAASDAAHALSASFSDVAATIAVTEDGAIFTASGQDGELVIDGNVIHIDAVDTLTVTTDADGAITGADASFPGAITLDDADGELHVTVQDAEAHLDASAHLTASFESAEVLLESDELTIGLTGGTLEAGDRRLTLHVDSVEVKKALAKELGLEIQDLTLELDTRADGTLGALDLSAASVQGHIDELHITATTEDGQKLRLHAETTADGGEIRRAFLLIPEGGEIELTQGELTVLLGPQKLSFENVGGVYSLRDDGIDIEASTKDLEVKVKGGSAEVALDSRTGELSITEITGTKIDVKGDGFSAHVDLEEVRGFVVEASGISGDVTGLEIRLVPTDEDSTLTASVHAKVAGIPVKLELDDCHELSALGAYGDNSARFSIGDPSGQGTVHVGLGPLQLKGSTVEAVLRYQEHDAERMASLVGRVISDEGIPLGKNASIDPDGVFRLHTGPKSPLVLGATVVLPRGTGATPLYLIDLKDGADDRAPGLLLELGPRFTPKRDKSFAPTLELGLLPGSYVDWWQVKGQASVIGLPLADEFQIPTTAVAALGFDARGPRFDTKVTLGAYATPAGWVPDGLPLHDQNLGGLFGGVKVKSGQTFDAQLDATVELDRQGHVTSPGARLVVTAKF